MRIMKNNENNYTNVSPSVSSSRNIPVAMSQRGWKVSFAILLGSARPVPCAKWCMRCSRAVKDSSAAFAFEGEGLLSSSRLNAASWSSHGCKDTGRMIKSALEVCTYRVSIRQISEVLVLCYKSPNLTSPHSVAITIICKDNVRTSSCHQRYCKRIFNEAAKRMIRSNSAEDVHNAVPENWQIRTTQNSALRCSCEQETDNS